MRDKETKSFITLTTGSLRQADQPTEGVAGDELDQSEVDPRQDHPL
jgi:hypothetical protein